MKSKIEEALKQVIDPETSMDVMRMKLVKNLVVDDGGFVSLKFIRSSPNCPLAFQLAFLIREAIKSVNGVTGLKMDVDNYVRSEELKKILGETDCVKIILR